MKKTLLSILSLGLFSAASAQCTDLFISEYVEGGNNNKAIELYNPTANTIDLSTYELWRYSNGSAVAGTDKKLALGGTIAAHSTYVIVIDRRDPQGTGQDLPVWDCLQAKADTFMSPDYNVNNVMSFNGNDVIVLLKGGTVLLDQIGVIGQDPAGNGWPDSNATGSLTKDHSLIRKETIQTGVTSPVTIALNPAADFDARLEWYDAGKNRFMNLGSHDCGCLNANVTSIDTTYGCPAAGIEEVENTSFSIFPNPSNTGSINIVSEVSPVAVRVYNVLGTITYEEKSNSSIQTVNTTNWKKGFYFVSLQFENGKTATKKVTIN